MHIELNNLSTSTFNKIKSNSIVFVEVIKTDGKDALLNVNSQKMKAHLNSSVPNSFFAYVEIEKDNDNPKVILRVLNSFKESKSFNQYLNKNENEISKNFLLENSLPLTYESMQVTLFIIRNHLPLNMNIFSLVYYSFVKYGSNFTRFISELLKNKREFDRDFIDLIANLKNMIKKFDIKKPIEFEEWKNGKIELDEKGNLYFLLNIIKQLIYDNSYQAIILKYNDEKIILQQRTVKKDNKKRYYFDFSSDRLKDFLIVVDLDLYTLEINIFLERKFLEENSNKIALRKNYLEDKIKSLFKSKKIKIEFLSFNKNTIFENVFSSENNNGKAFMNLDILI